MTETQRHQNLAKARRVRKANAERTRKQRDREHRAAKRVYAAACEAYYRCRRQFEEGSAQEKRAFSKMIRAEGEWFRTHPGDRLN